MLMKEVGAEGRVSVCAAAWGVVVVKDAAVSLVAGAAVGVAPVVVAGAAAAAAAAAAAVLFALGGGVGAWAGRLVVALMLVAMLGNWRGLKVKPAE